MTTKGDNRKQAQEEAERLLFSWPKRAQSLGLEFLWAYGLPMPEGAPVPPLWLKKAIHGLFGAPNKKTASEPITPEDLANLLGMLRGLQCAGELALKTPMTLLGASPEATKKAALFQERMATAVQPTWNTAKRILTAIPEDRYMRTLSEISAAHVGQKEASDYVIKSRDLDTNDGTLTEEILFFLWVSWPEAETAQSVADLHGWITRIKYASCSQKLLEKICTKIGFRKTKRGRKKRIPTPAR